MPKSNDLIKPFDGDFYKPFSTDIPEQGIYQSSLFGDFGWNPLTYYNVGGFLQGTYSTEMFTLMAGARYDDHSEYESKVNPRIASIAVDNGDGTIHYMRIPNEDLEPERFSAFEAGLRHMFNKNISAELIGYHNKIVGLMSGMSIELDPEEYPYADSTHAKTAMNSRDARSILSAVDFAASFSNIYKPIKLNTNLYFSYMKGKETLPNGDAIDVFRDNPKYLAKLRVGAIPIDGLRVGIDSIYCGEWYAKIDSKDDLENPDRKSDGYFTMDFIAHYKIPSKYGNFRVRLNVVNITNKTYGGYKYKDGPQYGRSFYGGIEYSF
jgi:outer membrane receptor protein involved in Fe transport